MTSMGPQRERRLASDIAKWTPIAGIGCVTVLIGGIALRTNMWSARTFVLLFYGALGCTLAAHAASLWIARLRWPPVRSWSSDVRRLLSFLALVLACWAWLPFLARPFVGWLARMAAVLRFF
jgi:hypothetical protein